MELKNIQIQHGNITDLGVDCIVNAANCTLLGGGGVDGAIHRKAGPRLLAACRKLGGCDTGEAKITLGYDLKAKYIIHTVGPVYTGSYYDAEMLYSCYWKSLQLAAANGIHSIAFPAISTGVYGYPIDEATEIALEAVTTWMSEHPDYAMEVIFSCFEKRTYDMYKWFEEYA